MCCVNVFSGSEHTTTYATPTGAGTGGGFWSGKLTFNLNSGR